MNEQILAIYRQYNQAMAAGDVTTLSSLLAPDFTLTHMTGYVQSRADWLAEQQAGTMHYYASVEEQVKLTAVENGYRVVGQNRVTASIHGGGKYEWPLNTEMLVQPEAGQWQIKWAVVTTY